MEVRPGEGGISFLLRGGRAAVPATLRWAVETPRCTTLERGGAAVSTVEHLLSALCALGIRAAEIQVDGGEIPILDGSAAPWMDLLLEASEERAQSTEQGWRVVRDWARSERGANLRLTPQDHGSIEVVIAVDHPLVGEQRASWRVGDERGYIEGVAPARTFGLASEATALRAAGLARGADLSCALVFSEDGVLNPDGLRFPDEPARHKLLDAIGDLALAGGPLLGGRVELERCSHALTVRWLKRALADGAIERT